MEEVESEDTVEETINGIRFVVTRFRVQEAIKLQYFLAKLIGPTIGNMIGAIANVVKGSLGDLKQLDGESILAAVQKSLGDLDLDGDALAEVIARLLDRLGSEEEYIAFLKRMLKKTTAWVNGQMKVFVQDKFETSLDAVFSGNTFSIISVIALVLRANYPDFLSGISRLSGGRIQRINTSAKADEKSRYVSEESETSED